MQHLSKAIRNAKSVKSSKGNQKEQIKELISRSIESDDIVDVFAMAGLERADISILNEDFLLGAKQEKDSIDIKIALLRSILLDEVKLRLHKNIKKYTSLKEELEKVIERYHSNAIDSYTTIAELIERAKQLQEEDHRTKELGLSDEELAFYDILASKKELINESGLIQDIVHGVVNAVKSNLQIDWMKKEDAKAAIRLAVKKELRGKVSMADLNSILLEIMEQAEGQFSEWRA
jgi:type I restriction enzyme R subunit